MNHQNPNFRFNGGYKQACPAKKPQRLHITVEQGKVAFRLLCPTAFVGALIGPSGTIVKTIELESLSKIRIEDAVIDAAAERLVYVIGAEATYKVATLRSVGDGEVRDAFDVSPAQEALLRVYERILQVEREVELCSDPSGGGGGGKLRCCRMLAVKDQIGPLMGREGRRIGMIRKESGAYIRVLTLEQLPPCAELVDELIQISGDGIAVRKALLLVSKCLQENQPKEKTSAVIPYGDFPYPLTQSYPNNGTSFRPFAGNAVNNAPECLSFKDKDSYPNINGYKNGSTIVDVVFRILCCSDIVGIVIGKGGSIVKALQDETGASIRFAAHIAGCDECLITISAMESVESHQSPAQNAVIRVFARTTKTLANCGLVPKWNNGEGVIARLLIPPNQVGCLLGVQGTIHLDLQGATGTMIKLLDGDLVPYCASNGDTVVQIAGEYVNVRNALVEVTRRLRERIVSSKGLNLEEGTNSNCNQTSNLASYTNETHTLEHEMEDLNISQGANIQLPHQLYVGKSDVTASSDNAELVSEDNAATVTNMTVQVPVPKNIFSTVFDGDGVVLAKLSAISGAKVELQHPSDDADKGKVIITGTPDQTLAGQSLLRAYIVTAK